MKKWIFGSFIFICAGALVLYKSAKKNPSRRREADDQKQQFASALHDMLNQKDKAQNYWQGEAKELIEGSIANSFSDRKLDAYRKSLIYSINLHSEENKMNEDTEKLIHEILHTIEPSSPPSLTP
jgi:hypothetical protein